jgi:hypothetical protein
MKYLVILLMVFCAQSVFAQVDSVGYQEAAGEYVATDEYSEGSTHNTVDPGEISQKKGYDAEPIDVQRFDENKWKKVIGDEDYLEGQPLEKREPKETSDPAQADTKRRMQKRDRGELNDSHSGSSGGTAINSPILTYIFYALALAIITYILWLVLKNISIKGKGKVSKKEAPDPSAPVADIKELEIDRLLREAMTAGNYRLAVRIYFLGLLKKLDEDGLITWKKDKTNRDYLTELFSKEYYFEEVKTLTLAYEEVWYGDHNFPDQTYEQIIASFKTIDQKLNASRAK